MTETMEQEIEPIRDLEPLKSYCNAHLVEISIETNDDPTLKVRYIDPDANFGVTGLGTFFFVDDCMYLITGDEKYKEHHNPDILEWSEELDYLNYRQVFIVRVIFAGIFTGFLDDNNDRIFTGDVVTAHPNLEAGVSDTPGGYAMIFDNHCVPLSKATELHIIGSLFYDLTKGVTEIDIRSACNDFAQSPKDRTELHKLLKRSPYYPPTTWQEKAKELLCGHPRDEE